MRIRPIPKKLLIHTINYLELAANNGWDNSFSEAITIDFVRVEPASSVQRTATSEGSDIKHILFVDRVHSSRFPDFKEKSKIVWNGQTFELKQIKPHYDFGVIPHHYELGLS